MYGSNRHCGNGTMQCFSKGAIFSVLLLYIPCLLMLLLPMPFLRTFSPRVFSPPYLFWVVCTCPMGLLVPFHFRCTKSVKALVTSKVLTYQPLVGTSVPKRSGPDGQHEAGPGRLQGRPPQSRPGWADLWVAVTARPASRLFAA